MASLDTDVEEQIMETIDPYNFRHFYREKPKLVAHNGRDEFFMPDDSWVWWEDMPGPKWVCCMLSKCDWNVSVYHPT